jgi:hypothetical protein
LATRSPRTWLLLTASTLAVTGSLAPSAQAQSSPPSEDDLFLVALRLGNLDLAEDVTAYKTSDGVCLDLAQTMQALEFPISVNTADGKASGWFLIETRTFSLDARSKTITLDGKTQPLSPGDITETADTLCVNIKALKRWFPISFEADLGNAIVKLVSREALPIERQIERRARQLRLQREVPVDLSLLPRVNTPYANLRPPAIDTTAEFITQKTTRAANTQTLRRYTILAAGEVAKLSSEVYIGSSDKGVPKDVRARLYRRSADGDLLGRLKATEFAVGDVSGRSSNVISDMEAGRGLSLTNVPLDTPQNFDRTTFRGDIPSGWDVELYRNGQLLAFENASGNGRYEFRDIPLTFGFNNFEIVAYGPQGQVRRETRGVNVGPQAIPPGKLWYAAGAFDTNHNLFNINKDNRLDTAQGIRSFASLQYGFSRNTSVGFAAESLLIRKRRHTYLEGSVSQTLGAVGTALAATIDTTGGQALEMLAFGNASNVEVSTRHAMFNNFTSERISDSLQSRHSLRAYTAPTLFRQTVPITLDATFDRRRRAADQLNLTNRVSLNMRGILFAHEARLTSTIGNRGSSSPTRWVNALLWNAGSPDFRMRGEFAYRIAPDLGVERFSLGADWYKSERTDIRAQMDWSPPQKDWRLGVGVNQLFNVFTVGARAEIGRGGTFTLGLSFTTGINRGADGRFYASRHRPAQMGEAAIQVFEDLNRNGIMDGDDRPVPGVGFAAQSNAADTLTNARGMVRLESLRPFQSQAVSLDQSTLPDTALRPKYKSISVVPRPGVVNKIEFPLYPTGDVDGTVWVNKDNRKFPGSGLLMQLLDTNGVVKFSGKTDHEGYFVLEGIDYGTYALRLDPAQAVKLGLQTGTARLISINDTKPSLSGQDLVLTPAPETVLSAPRLELPVPIWAN